MSCFEKPMQSYEYEAHQLANQFDMIEDGEDGGAAFESLKTSIANDGILVPIKLFEGKILDGRNRYKAAKAVEHGFTLADFDIFRGTYEEAKAYVDAANIHRRHLSSDQRDALIKKRITEHPRKSNRQIALMCGVSHTHVNNLRRDMQKPPEGDKQLERFEKTWEELTDQQRESFVDKFAGELCDMLDVPPPFEEPPHLPGRLVGRTKRR